MVYFWILDFHWIFCWTANIIACHSVKYFVYTMNWTSCELCPEAAVRQALARSTPVRLLASLILGWIWVIAPFTPQLRLQLTIIISTWADRVSEGHICILEIWHLLRDIVFGLECRLTSIQSVFGLCCLCIMLMEVLCQSPLEGWYVVIALWKMNLWPGT